MIKKRLLMTFKTALGKKVSLAIDEPREDVTEGEIVTLMDSVLAKNLFTINGDDLTEKVDAKIVVTDTTEFDLI